ncbi:FkbM family methyltransferase [Thioclava sp. 15-R06ZXC-3]|uniref:FkbM family methyltransferase n=1 Tax=Thioclava arctica TaxID=3238301 RepID=A0ABV3TJ19_9RHOB
MTRKKPIFRSLRLWLHRVTRRKVTRLDGLCLICAEDKVPRSVAAGIIKGGYELAERQLARKAIRSTDRVIEIGAGVGVVGLICTKAASEGRVTSYEANSTLETIIRENYALNGLSPNLILKAVTVDGSPITFFRDPGIVSSSVIDRGLKSDQVTVESVSIKQALEETKANVLVMDVEGGEIALLEAADLSSIREMIIEVHPHIMGEKAIDGMLANLVERGFNLREKRHKTVWLSRETS